MLDHLIVDLISEIHKTFEEGLLVRQAIEERFQVDVFLGDLSFETSYSLPGEGQPPRVRADISLDWPTWSQTSYRSWSIGEALGELPEVVLQVAVRIQRLSQRPDMSAIEAAIPNQSPHLGASSLLRSAITIEEVHAQSVPLGQTPSDSKSKGVASRWAVEATYEGSLRLEEENLEDTSTIQPLVKELTRWLSSTLVALADLPLLFLPPDNS